jgi:hypothetical protein
MALETAEISHREAIAEETPRVLGIGPLNVDPARRLFGML